MKNICKKQNNIKINTNYNLYLGDNLESLKKLETNSVDSVVTDPPYGLKFMAKKWDYSVPSVELWKEVLRVLKPGGHVLSFGGTRTYHRMVVNCEDAGFEVRDCISWLYGSGFPKSHNIGKAIDKKKAKSQDEISDVLKSCGLSTSKIAQEIGVSPQLVKFWIDGERSTQPKEIIKLNKLLNVNLEYIEENNEIVGVDKNAISGWDNKVERNIIKPTTINGKKYEGWGTALKPAQELILLARKPLDEKTIADNVLKHGTGGINIDCSRVGSDMISSGKSKVVGGGQLNNANTRVEIEETFSEGRFPANIILDEEAAKCLDEQSGISKSTPNIGLDKYVDSSVGKNVAFKRGGDTNYTDEGGASRFFYVAKCSKKERNLGCEELEKTQEILEGRNITGNKLVDELHGHKAPQHNSHPTVKPIKLMKYLVKLITPPDGIVLDPYMGSGSTGVATLLEGFNFIGMELDENYMKIAEARISNYEKYEKIIK